MANPIHDTPTGSVRLRDVTAEDLPVLFEQQLDPEANRMAAFTSRDPSDWDAFMAHWNKVLANPTIINKAILWEGQVAGSIACYQLDGKPHIGYWIGREFWGKGIATRALAAFITEIDVRPLYASAARDNAASLRVLEKCGFVITGYETSFAKARGEEIEEALLELR